MSTGIPKSFEYDKRQLQLNDAAAQRAIAIRNLQVQDMLFAPQWKVWAYFNSLRRADKTRSLALGRCSAPASPHHAPRLLCGVLSLKISV